MAYTKADLERVQQALLAFAAGERVASVTHNGRTVQYSSADIASLRELAAEIENYLANQDAAKRRRSRTRYVSTGKGY